MNPRIGASEGQGHRPMPAAMAGSAKLNTNRYSTNARIGLGSALVICLPTGLTDWGTSAGRGRRTGRLSGAPRDEIAVLANRGLDELIQDVIDGVADEPRIEQECVAVRFLQPTDVTHGSDAVGASLDDRHEFTPLHEGGARQVRRTK